MSLLDDVNAQLATNAAKLTKIGSDLTAFISSNSGGASDADLQGLLTTLQGQGTTLDAIDEQLNPPAVAAPSGN